MGWLVRLQQSDLFLIMIQLSFGKLGELKLYFQGRLGCENFRNNVIEFEVKYKDFVFLRA